MDNSDVLLNVIDNRCKKAIKESNIPSKIVGKISSVEANNKYANVKVSGYDVEFRLLNKTGETLSVNDSVFIEYVKNDLTNGFISERFGVASVSSDIVESGSNSNGKYIKWADGTMICYMNKSYANLNITNVWGNFYESDPISLGNFPMPFISTPSVTASCIGDSTVYIEVITPTNTSIGTTWFARPNPLSNTSTIISFIAIGRWK